MIVERVEKHQIKSGEYLRMFFEYCHESKNLYNQANYLIRQEFVNNGKWLRYSDIDKLVKKNKEYPDYRKLPAKVSQQTLRQLDSNWNAFFKSIKDWSRNPEKYSGKPELPKYKKKDGYFPLYLTNQVVKYRDGLVQFPKFFNYFMLKPKFRDDERFHSFQQARVIPKSNYIELELVYKIKIDEYLEDNGNYMSIDLGIDNLEAITTNTGTQPILVNGKGLKAINQWYNKQKSKYQASAKVVNENNYSKTLHRLDKKRSNQVKDFMHKVSRFTVGLAEQNNCNTIIIGKNKNWKQDCNLGKKTNQSFTQIPHNQLIAMITYKAQEKGIQVKVIDESYTSGTSFLDYEKPTSKNYDKSRRIERGLFKSNEGKLINADVNASLQILKKCKSDAQMSQLLEGSVFNPLRINLI